MVENHGFPGIFLSYTFHFLEPWSENIYLKELSSAPAKKHFSWGESQNAARLYYFQTKISKNPIIFDQLFHFFQNGRGFKCIFGKREKVEKVGSFFCQGGPLAGQAYRTPPDIDM